MSRPLPVLAKNLSSSAPNVHFFSTCIPTAHTDTEACSYIQNNEQNCCNIAKNKQISHSCYCCCRVTPFTCRTEWEPHSVCLQLPSFPNRPVFVFPDNTLNSLTAEDNTGLLILAPVAATRPQPSGTEEPVTAGPTLCL